MKRFLSLILSVAMLCTVITVPAVTVSAATSYPDYVPGAKPANMLKTASELGGASSWWASMGTISDSAGKVSRSATNGYKGTSITAKGTPGGEMTGTAGVWYLLNAGVYVGSKLINSNNASGIEGDIDDGKNYVYAMQVRNLDATYTPRVRFLLYDIDGPAPLNAKEWGDAGMPVTSTDWMDFKGTIQAPERNKADTVNDVDRLSIGFNASTVAGSSIEMNFTDDSNGMYPMYFAEEKAYDITNTLTSSSSVITVSNSATFKAEVTNQIGNPGYLDQTFTWMALDKATRSETIDGIVITPSDDTTSATVTITEDAELGIYDIVAYNATYNMAKGYTITVDVPSKYVDYKPIEKPANMFRSASEMANDSAWWASMGTTSNKIIRDRTNGYKCTYIKAAGTPGETMSGDSAAWYLTNGVYAGATIIKSNIPNGFEGDIDDGKNYVYAMQVRNADSTYTPKVRFMLYDLDGPEALDAIEWGSAGMSVTSTDWMDFKGTIQAPERNKADTVNDVDRISIGFNNSTLAGSKIEINFIDDSEGMYPMYFAEEALYDITNTLVSGSSAVQYGDRIKLKAQVVNQVGITGTLAQNFTWKALDNATRKVQADGIKVTPSNDTTTATVFIGEDVPAGEYAIVAYSEDYSMAKGFVINVEKADALADYMGTKPANIITDNTLDTNFSGRWLVTFDSIFPGESDGVAGAMRYRMVANPEYWGATSTTPIVGGEMTKAIGTYKWKAVNYVISTDLKNHPDATVQKSKLGYMIDSRDGTNISKPYKMLDITSSEWQTFKFVLHVTAEGTAQSKFHYGYPQAVADRNPQGTDILHRLGSFYLAEEVPYAIKISGENTTLRAGEGSISLNAEVLNQLEIPYESETSLKWYVTNEYRTKVADGFTLTPSADGKSVTVSASSSVPYGKYTVIAEDSSLGISGFRKGITITVIPYDIDISEDGALIYVAPDGDDSDYGTKDNPLATFEAALRKIEELHARDIPVAEVIFRGGEYRVNRVTVKDIHSGTRDKSIVFKSYPGEKAVFKGSVELDMSKAEHVTQEDLLNRMYPEVHDKVVVIDLSEQGINEADITELTDVNSIYALQNSADYNTIYVNGVEQPIAQWPNGREYTTWTPIQTWSWSSFKNVTEPYQMGYTNGDNPDRWANATQWWVSVFPDWDFTRYRVSPQSIDTSKNIIHYSETVNTKPVPGLTSTASRRWKAYNLLEEIDLPGEFYIDRENMLLYFYPPYDIEDAKVEFSTVKTLLSVNNASNITFKDLHFTQNTSTAVTISDVVNVDFENCSFTNIGYKGLVNSGNEKPITGANYWHQSYMYNDSSYNCDVRGCLFDNCGGVSLQMVGGNADTLTPSGNIIENNIITRSNQRSMVDASMLVAGVGNTVRNNNFAKSTQHAITLIGNDHLIEKNEIHNVLREVADAGAIYQGRNQMQRGTTISANLIHDIWPTDSRLTTGTVGIYMDDCHQGNTIKNNFFIGTKTGYNSHGAAAQKILDNIMVDTNYPWSFPGNPNSSTETKAKGGTNDWDMKDGVADKVRSTMYDTEKNTDTLETFLSEIYDLDLYRTRYPELADWIDTNKNPHSYTVFNGNISVDGATKGSMCWDDTNFAKIGTNPTDYTKDIFVNPADLDYRVKSTSEAAIANPKLLSDANFDMDWVGVQNSFVLNNTTAPFKLLYPTANEPVGTAVELFWEDALLANRYEITVATDAQFNNKVVVSEEIHNNIYYLSGLTAGTRYYWKVTAKNTSRDFKSTWESDVGTFFVSDITLTNTALKTNGNTVSFDINISSSKSQDATVYTLAYDKEGNMKIVDKQDKTISSAVQKLPVSFDTKGEFIIDYVKILVWKKGDVTPLRSAKILKK